MILKNTFIIMLLLLLMMMIEGQLEKRYNLNAEKRFHFSQAHFQTPLLTFSQRTLRTAFSSIFETESGERFRARLLKCDIFSLM